MIITVTSPPRLLEVRLEPTEIRCLRLDFWPALRGTIATLECVDPAALISGLTPAGTVAVVRIAAPLAGASHDLSIIASTASGQSERQTLRVSGVDPAAGIEEIYP